MNEATTLEKVQTADGSPSPLICRLRSKVVIGRQGPIPNMGEVDLENCSGAPVEIAYTMTPLQFLEVEVVGPDQRIVSEGHFSDHFSPMCEPAVLRLLPGEKFTAQVPLLSTVPREKRFPGNYVIQVWYRFQGPRVLAEPLHLQLPSQGSVSGFGS